MISKRLAEAVESRNVFDLTGRVAIVTGGFAAQG
jgi:hypothetical protein